MHGSFATRIRTRTGSSVVTSAAQRAGGRVRWPTRTMRYWSSGRLATGAERQPALCSNGGAQCGLATRCRNA
jgi:hypothetical protein